VSDTPLPRRWLLLLLALPIALSSIYFFVCDDAFIAFRFVRNLLAGEGIVFNRGEYVEGYTSFLWVLELAGLWAVGLRPEYAAPALGELSTLITGLGIAALARRSPHGAAATAIALLWWGTNRSVAVWATSGLETRQFSALITWALVFLSDPARERGPRLGSLLCALAVLTRPEALVIGPVLLAWAAWDRWLRGALTPGLLIDLAAPFITIVGAHFLWRHAYYGEWLPNTYYAKNVRDWWEAGGMFLTYAAIEHAGWLVLPLAGVGTLSRWRQGDRTHVAMWLWAVPSYVHLAKIGGDHFEFRMFDELWPVLYLAAADGLLVLLTAPRARAIGAAAVTLYGLAIPVSHDILAFQRNGRGETEHMKVRVDTESSPWLHLFQPIPAMLGLYNRWGDWVIDHSVGIRHREHQMFARLMRVRYAPYARFEETGIFQPDAIAAESSIGYYGFYLHDLFLIDKKGLCDWTIARTPVEHDDAHRQLAHDRGPPPGYLEERGVNIEPDALHDTRDHALRDGEFAVELAPGAWAAFSAAKDPTYVNRAFPGRVVWDRTWLADPWRANQGEGEPIQDAALHAGKTYTIVRRLGSFDDGVDGWTLEGPAFDRQPAEGAWIGQGPLGRWSGAGLLNSYHPSWRDRVTGRATSPDFVPQPGEWLSFRIGGSKDEAALVLVGAQGDLGRWSGQDSETLRRELVSLEPWVGQTVHLEARDEGERAWGHILLDAVAIVRP
jgi:arabinofuranosyltransferase